MTAAITTRWVEDGSADAILALIRWEARGRQRMAPEILHEGSFPGDPLAFDVWMPLPEEWTRSSFASRPCGSAWEVWARKKTFRRS